MRILVNLPFADLRAFSERGLAERLSRPAFPVPVTGFEFVRRFGQVREYPSRYAPPWAGENYYCDASRLLVFDQSLNRMVQGIELHHLGRRLFTDGKVGRTEVEFRGAYSGDNDYVIQQIAKIKVRVGKLEAGRLIDSGGRVAEEYAAATLPVALRKDDRSTLPKLVLPGKPMIVISRVADERSPEDILDRNDAEWIMDQKWSTTGDSRTALWTLVHRKTATKQDVERARRHAIRLHSELETFAIVLRACMNGLVDVTKSEKLNEYLYRSAERLVRNKYDNWPQVEIYKAIASSRQEGREAELAALEETFHSVKPGMRHMLRDASGLVEMTNPADESAGIRLVQNIKKDVYLTVMNDDNSIHLGSNNKISNFVGSGSRVFNSQIGSASAPDIRDLVHTMMEQLRELESPASEDLVDFGEIIEHQLTVEPLQVEKIQTRLDRLLEGVKKVGEVGLPVAKTIGEIMKMLAV